MQKSTNEFKFIIVNPHCIMQCCINTLHVCMDVQCVCHWLLVCGSLWLCIHIGSSEGLFILKWNVFPPCCLWQVRLNLDSLHGINFTVYFISILSSRSSRMSFCTTICLAFSAQAFPVYLPLLVCHISW